MIAAVWFKLASVFSAGEMDVLLDGWLSGISDKS